MIVRSRHWSDFPHPTDAKKRVRHVQFNLNYYDENGQWQRSNDNAEPIEGTKPYRWDGAYDFQRKLLNAGPLQAFVGDTTTPGNTALIGVRLDNHVRQWLNLKLLNVNAVDPNYNAKKRAAVWAGVQNNLAMIAAFARDKLALWLRISGSRVNNFVRFAVRQPDGFGFTIQNNEVHFTTDTGVEYLRTRPKFGVSGTMGGPDETGSMFDVAISEGRPITVGNKTYRTLVITWDAVAVAALLATGKIAWIDPTIDIYGTVDFKDAGVRNNSPYYNYNYGAATTFSVGAVYYAHFIVRTLALPEGTYTRVRLVLTANDTAGTSWFQFFQHKTGQAAWVEGTANGAVQTGSVCWNYAKYAATAWLGGTNGGGTSSDIDASAIGEVSYSPYDEDPGVPYQEPV